MTEELLTGGGVTPVVRRGAFVHRARGPQSDRVAALLGHLRSRGFTGAPRHHGVDEQGRDVLDFVPGEVAHGPPSDGALVSAARLLRGLHDATTEAAAWRDGWLLPGREAAEVVCHGDFAPYNVVFDGDRAVGVIDFDTAHPGPRAWDVAYAVYRFAPWAAGGPDPAEQARRAALFCDAYGPLDRAGLTAVAVERLRALVAYMHEQAAAGNAAFAEHIARGDAAVYERNIVHIARHAGTLSPPSRRPDLAVQRENGLPGGR